MAKPRNNGELAAEPVALGAFRVTAVGVEVAGEPSFREWAETFRTFATAERSMQWILGDLLLLGQERFGETWSQVVDPKDYADGTLKTAVWVAKAFPRERRHEALTFTHHKEVAALPPAEADAILADAAENGLSARDVRTRVLAAKVGENPGELTVPRGTDDASAEPVEVSDDPAKCAETVLAVQKYLRKARDLYSALFTGAFAAAARNACGGYTRCAPEKTGERVESGKLGPVTFGIAEYTCDAFDELLACLGGLRAMYERAGRGEVPGAGVGEWERE